MEAEIQPEQEQNEETCTNDKSSRSKSNIDKDFISKLPDEVLVKILSIYPFDSASKSIAILTGLWNRPYITHGGIENFESIITEFLILFDEYNPLKTPRKLEFHFNQDMILSATIGLNKKLHLDFSKSKQVFPRQFGWHLSLNTMDLPHKSPYPFFVKTLKLTCVNYVTSEMISNLISKFRYIECLIIEKCNGLRSLRVDGLVKLVKLSIEDCDDLKSVFIETMELQCLQYRGLLSWFSMENVKYLEDVMLDAKGFGFNHSSHRLHGSLLRAMRDVKVLTLHGWIYKEVFGPWLSTEHHEQHFRFSKLEDLWWIDTSMQHHNINSLFSFLKFCTSLKRLFININPQTGTKSRDQSFQEIQNGARLRKLKVVKLEGFTNENDIIFFKEHLMQVFNIEPRVIEVRHGHHSRCLIRIPNRQKNGKRPSKESLNSKFCYKFVEEVEDNIGLCSKHPHMP